MLRLVATLFALAGAAQAQYGGYRHRGGVNRDGDHAPEPASGYEEPAAAYDAPEPSYGAPSYASPSYSAPAEAGLPDLTPIIIGILVLTGLSLLFPTYVTVTGRRKRSADVAGTEGKSRLRPATNLPTVLFQHLSLSLSPPIAPSSFPHASRPKPP